MEKCRSGSKYAKKLRSELVAMGRFLAEEWHTERNIFKMNLFIVCVIKIKERKYASFLHIYLFFLLFYYYCAASGQISKQ
jgi:hypothetical protein